MVTAVRESNHMAFCAAGCRRLFCLITVAGYKQGLFLVQAHQARGFGRQALEQIISPDASPDFYVGSVPSPFPYAERRFLVHSDGLAQLQLLNISGPPPLPTQQEVHAAAAALKKGLATAQKGVDDVWTSDMFPKPSSVTKASDEIITPHEIVMFFVLCAVFCVFHYILVTHMPPSLTTHMYTLVLWLLCAILYNGLIWARHGADNGSLWATGYVLEWMLSMDNLFVFHLIFKHFKTPPEELDKALFLGIAGAILLRIVFFFVSYSLLDYLTIARYLFGGLLIYSGIQGAVADEEEEEDLSESRTLQSLVGMLGGRLALKYSESRLFIWDTGKLQVTMLLPVVFMLEFTDLLFAVDSVAAKIGLIEDKYIAYTSTVLAMFGLRAMFFVVQFLVECFDLLKYGIAFILVFIGVELVLHDFIDLSPTVALGIIMATMVVSILASIVNASRQAATKALDGVSKASAAAEAGA